MPIIRSGGVSTDGGTLLGEPSPAGKWGVGYNEQIVDFDRDAFTRLLAGKGYDVLWQKAMPCPNVPVGGLHPLDHPSNCQVCDDGLGFIYFGDTPTRMLIQSIRLDQSYHAWGRWDRGRSLVTSLP